MCAQYAVHRRKHKLRAMRQRWERTASWPASDNDPTDFTSAKIYFKADFFIFLRRPEGTALPAASPSCVPQYAVHRRKHKLRAMRQRWERTASWPASDNEKVRFLLIQYRCQSVCVTRSLSSASLAEFHRSVVPTRYPVMRCRRSMLWLPHFGHTSIDGSAFS